MPIGWVAAAGAVSSIVGGAMQAGAATSAADTQAAAATHAADIGQQEFQTITQQEQPYMQGGYGALSALDYGLGISPQAMPASSSGSLSSLTGSNPSGWTMSPDGTMHQQLSLGELGSTSIPRMTATQGMPSSGTPSLPSVGAPGMSFGSLTKPFGLSDFYNLSPAYQFQKQQGTQGVLNGASSGQGALSGSTMKDLMDYNQNLASTSFGNAFNQYQTQQGNIFNRLSGIAQLGQTAAANTGQQGTALTGQIGQSITNAGTAAAAGQIGSANAWSGASQAALPWLQASTQQPQQTFDQYGNETTGW